MLSVEFASASNCSFSGILSHFVHHSAGTRMLSLYDSGAMNYVQFVHPASNAYICNPLYAYCRIMFGTMPRSATALR